MVVTDLVGGVTVVGGRDARLMLARADTTTFTGSYLITQADVDAGHFANTAEGGLPRSPVPDKTTKSRVCRRTRRSRS